MRSATTSPIPRNGRTYSTGRDRPTAGGCISQSIPAPTKRRSAVRKCCQERLQGFLPTGRPFEIVGSNLYTVHQRVAQKFRSGRAILAGNSAHVNSPIGAMGMNSGVHDAFNLADKLVAILRGEADADVLDRYERQRRHVAVQHTQVQTMRNKRLLAETDPTVRKRNQDELRRTAEDPVRARAFLLRASLIESLREAEAIL